MKIPSPGKTGILVLLVVAGFVALCFRISDFITNPDIRETRALATNSRHSNSIRMNRKAEMLARFQDRSNRADIILTLQKLQTNLAPMPRDEVVKWIDSFLTKRGNKPTRLSFMIRKDHAMTEGPIFRTFLKDVLLAIDPSDAPGISLRITSAPTSTNEWPLALPNVGKAESFGKLTDYLRTKPEELISNPIWRAEPFIVILNSIDLPVRTKATASRPQLSSPIERKDCPDPAHAAFLTLDRLVQHNLVKQLTHFCSVLTLAPRHPRIAAPQFARAELRDPTQREIVKTWLLAPPRTSAGFDHVTTIHPNNNRFISTNLLTTAAPLPADNPSLTLSDPAPPPSKALYRIMASAP